MRLNEVEYNRRKSNIDFLDEGLILVEKEIKQRIRKVANSNSQIEVDKLRQEQDIYTSLLTGLTGVWSEALVKSLLENSNDFTQDQKNKIFGINSLKEKWMMTYYASISKTNSIQSTTNSSIPRRRTILSHLSSSTDKLTHFRTVENAIERILPESVDLRNKIQHGEWIHGYSKNQNRDYVYDSVVSSKLNDSNLVLQRLRRYQIKQIYLILLDLSSFRNRDVNWQRNHTSPYEKFLEKRIKQIQRLENEIDALDYSKYVNDLIERERKSSEWRKRNKFGFLIQIWKIFK